jgi:hypothetical protein
MANCPRSSGSWVRTGTSWTRSVTASIRLLERCRPLSHRRHRCCPSTRSTSGYVWGPATSPAARGALPRRVGAGKSRASPAMRASRRNGRTCGSRAGRLLRAPVRPPRAGSLVLHAAKVNIAAGGLLASFLQSVPASRPALRCGRRLRDHRGHGPGPTSPGQQHQVMNEIHPVL